jgi:hypothetical protein
VEIHFRLPHRHGNRGNLSANIARPIVGRISLANARHIKPVAWAVFPHFRPSRALLSAQKKYFCTAAGMCMYYCARTGCTGAWNPRVEVLMLPALCLIEDVAGERTNIIVFILPKSYFSSMGILLTRLPNHRGHHAST